MITQDDVRNTDLSRAKRRIRFKAYPSTGVEKARSKRTNGRPQFSPTELRVMQEKFAELAPQDRPKICFEHGRRANLKELGTVVNMEYNQMDGWMYLDGEIDGDKIADVEKLIDSGLRGASLCFGINEHCKRLIEVSLVENPDFSGASVVSYHSADATDWSQKAYVPAKLINERRAMSEQLLIHELSDGSYVVPHEKYLEAGRAHVAEKGGDPSRVEVVDPSILNNLPEDERSVYQAAMLAESRLLASRSKQEETQKMEQSVLQAREVISTLTSGTDIGPDLQKQLGLAILEDPKAAALSKLAAEKLREQERKIQQLSEENKKHERRMSEIQQRARTAIMMHSAGNSGSFADMWERLDAMASKSTSSSSSSSSSSAPMVVHEHSYESGRAPAKRIMREAEPSEADQRIEGYRKKFRSQKLDLWPAEKDWASTASDGSRMFAHSVGTPAGARFATLSDKSTNAEVIEALHHDILTGRRRTGLPPQVFHSHNLLVDNPEIYLKIADDMEMGRLLTNKDVGLFGSAQAEDGSRAPSSREMPVICGFSKSRLSALKNFSVATFGEC